MQLKFEIIENEFFVNGIKYSKNIFDSIKSQYEYYKSIIEKSINDLTIFENFNQILIGIIKLIQSLIKKKYEEPYNGYHNKQYPGLLF